MAERSSSSDQTRSGAQCQSGRWIAALLVICFLCTAATLRVACHRPYIGWPDEAAYVEQADSLLAGRGFTIGYVQHFFRRYSDIAHPEDHFGPGNGVLLCPGFYLFGRSPFAAVIPSVLCACLLLPLLAYALTRQLGPSPAFAFGCALTVMFDGLIRHHAMQSLADLPFTVCIVAAAVLTLRRGRWLPLATGACLAAAYYIKPAALLFVPAIGLAYIIIGTGDRRTTARPLLLFAASFAVLIAPWLVRNWMLFADPLYSANKHIAFIEEFDSKLRAKVWWADPDQPLPGLAQTLRRYGLGKYIFTLLNRAQNVLFESGAKVFGLWMILGVLLLSADRQIRALFAILAVFVVGLCLIFHVESRYLLPALPLAHTIAWAFGWRLAEGLPLQSAFSSSWLVRAVATLQRALPRWKTLHLSTWVALAACLLITGNNIIVLAAATIDPGRPFRHTLDTFPAMKAARWASQHLPVDAHIMTCPAVRFRYYSQRKVVAIPSDTPDKIAAVVAAYDVQYIVLCAGEVGLRIDCLQRYLNHYKDDWKVLEESEEGYTFYVRQGAIPPSRGAERPSTLQIPGL